MRQENALPHSTVKAETKLAQGFSQIMPEGWVEHTSAASGALLKAKPQGLALEGWGHYALFVHKGKRGPDLL